MDICLRSTKQLKSEFTSYSTIHMDNPLCTIGRALSNSTVIPSIALSRSHCILQRMPDSSWTIKDISSGEIKVNREPIPKHTLYAIKDNDVIQLDPYGEFTYVFDSKPSDTIIDNKKYNNRKRKYNKIQSQDKDFIYNPCCSESLIGNDSMPNCVQKHCEDSILKQRNKILEDKNVCLTEKLTNQTREFEKNIAEALVVKQNKIEALKEKLAEGKQNMEKKIKKLEQKHSEEIDSLKKTFNMEMDDLRKNINLGKDQISELHMKLHNNTLATERERELFLEEQKQKEDKFKMEHDNAITEYMLKNAALELEKDEMERSLLSERNNFQNTLNAKEAERKNLLNALLKKTKQAEKSLRLLKKKVKLHGMTDKHKRQSKNSSEASSSRDIILPEVVQHDCAVIQEYNKLMETELRCSICTEIFVKPFTLNCGHSFCKHCLNVWKKKKNVCPCCRAKITSHNQSVVLDSVITAIILKLDDETRKTRMELVKEREDAEKKIPLRNITPQRRVIDLSSDDSTSNYEIEEANEEDVVYYSFGFRRWNYYVSSESDDSDEE